MIKGQKYGKWTIIEFAGRDKKSNQLIKCECDCGFVRINRLSLLTDGESLQCKTCSLKQVNDMETLVGKIFGKWTVLFPVTNYTSKSNKRYLCKCECGTEKSVDAYRLRSGKSNSCPHCRLNNKKKFDKKVCGYCFCENHSDIDSVCELLGFCKRCDKFCCMYCSADKNYHELIA